MNKPILYSMLASITISGTVAIGWAGNSAARLAAAHAAAVQPSGGAAAPPDVAATTVGQTIAPAANQTLLNVDLSVGAPVVSINGQAVGSLQSTTQVDVSRFVHTGANVMRVMWMGDVQGTLKITHADQPAAFRDVDTAFLAPDGGQPAGERTVTFYL